jgi:hypothetical protein
MRYLGKNKEAAQLVEGDLISITGYSSDVAEVVSVDPIGDKIRVKTSNNKSAIWLPNKTIRLYI